jgi:DNA-directed RNA polymerase subunit L
MEKEDLIGPPDEFSFIMKGVTVSITIANNIRRIIGLDIPTFTISPETIDYNVNTSAWDPEMITHQISLMPMKPDFLNKADLNMLELTLDVKNEEMAYRYVLSKEFILKNIETNKTIPINNIFVYDNLPIVLLGPKQNINLTCKMELITKRDSDSRHQAGMAGIDYISDEKDPDKDPDEILFNVNLQTGISPKELISLSFDNLINRLQKLQEAIKTNDPNLLYIQLNRYHRYDFVFIGEDHTIGSLIEKWNNRHDSRSVTGYRETRDKKAITIDYGLNKFSPVIFTENNNGNGKKLENLVTKSLASIDKGKEKEQKDSTIKIFLENLSRLEQYIMELKTDWNKVKVLLISNKDYMNDINQKRIERLNRP